MTIGLCAYIAIAAATGVLLLAVPAYPTTYLSSPVRYTTLAIADGAAHYAERCAGCHGSDGRGEGPAARALAIRPADLVAHAAHHRYLSGPAAQRNRQDPEA